MANAAQCAADIYFRYDQDLNSHVTAAEIASAEPGSSLTATMFFKTNSLGSDGADRTELVDVLLNPATAAQFLSLVPSFSAMWRPSSNGLMQAAHSDRHIITAIIPELEAMPKDYAFQIIGTMKDLLIDLDVFARWELANGRISQIEYHSYMRALTLFLQQKAKELSPNEFLNLVKDMYAGNRDLKNVKLFVKRFVPVDRFYKFYGRFSNESPPKGMKFILVYNEKKRDFEMLVKPLAFRFDKKDKSIAHYVPLAVSTKKGNIVTFEKNINEKCPWLAPFGRIRMLEGLKRARAKIKALGLESRVPGSGDVPPDDSISDAYALSFIYAERLWSAIDTAKSDEEREEYMDVVDMTVALDGSEAYCNIKSGSGALGITQMTAETHEDAKAYYPKAGLKGFKETACNLDKALFALFLMLDRKREVIAIHMRKDEGAKAEDVVGYFFGDKHPFPSDPEITLAIAYNNSLSNAVKYAMTGRLNGTPSNTKRYSSSIKQILHILSEPL
jgi:hypothetical protein